MIDPHKNSKTIATTHQICFLDPKISPKCICSWGCGLDPVEAAHSIPPDSR